MFLNFCQPIDLSDWFLTSPSSSSFPPVVKTFCHLWLGLLKLPAAWALTWLKQQNHQESQTVAWITLCSVQQRFNMPRQEVEIQQPIVSLVDDHFWTTSTTLYMLSFLKHPKHSLHINSVQCTQTKVRVFTPWETMDSPELDRSGVSCEVYPTTPTLSPPTVSIL